MNHFQADDKLSKLIHANYFLLPVINRFGLRLGFKNKTVEEVCKEKGIDKNFFLAIVNTYSNEDYFPEKDLLQFPPELLVDYLRKTHKYYFTFLFPEVERRLKALLTGCIGTCDDLQLINTFYNKYKMELSRHLEEEENKVFPYVIALVESTKKGKPIPENFSQYRMQSREPEHNQVDQKIYDLKNIVIKYMEPSYNDDDGNAFLFAIFQFERDLIDHARIEDKILMPQVLEMEQKLRNG